MNLYLEEYNNDVCLYSKDANGNIEYCESPEEFEDIVRYFKRAGFQILDYGKDLVLSNKKANVKMVIRDYRRSLLDPDVASLKELVTVVRRKQGVINKKGTNNKLHPTHLSKHAKKAVALALSVVVIGGTVIGLAVKDNQKELPLDNEITAVSMETPLHIKSDSSGVKDDYDIFNFEYEITPGIETVEETPSQENHAELDYERLYDTPKAISCKNNYYSLISKYATKMGIDPELMLAVATQERGVHSTQIDDGGGIGLMQVQYNVHLGEELYYKELGEDGMFHNKKMVVSDDDMRNLETNIKLGCIIMQQCLNWTNYNIPMAIQMYNQGYGSIHDLLVTNYDDKGTPRINVVNNPTDLSWRDFTGNYAGDPEYLEHILQWSENPDFTCIDSNSMEEVNFSFSSTLDRAR